MGPGIPPEIRDRIFESYFTTKPVGVGTGIGLSISKSIVERHNGKIWFEEVPSGGARFVVELPVPAGQSQSAEAAQAENADLRRALIIDDEPDVAGSLSDILELMGLRSEIVSAWTSAGRNHERRRARYRVQRPAHARQRAALRSIASCLPSAPDWRGASCW